MKVGLVTITHGQNYGNRLQNYAIQAYLESNGIEVETIRHQDYIFEPKFRFRQILKKISRFGYTKRAHRIDTFNKFNKEHIKFSKLFLMKDNNKIATCYDVFACGSDQIWNPSFFYSEEERDSYFLSFAGDKPKVSISASFGVDTIEEKEKERIRKRLLEMSAISVRETSGVEIVKNLSGRDAELVIDPTMSLTKEQWIEIEKKPKIKELDDFVVIYLLGQYDKEKLIRMKETIEQSGKRVVFLENEYNYYNISTNKEFCIDPSEFVWLFHHSSQIITDSFHAIIFALIFNRDFCIVERDLSEGDLSSRIKQLINTFRLEEKYYDWKTNETINNKYDADFVKVEIERMQSEYHHFIENSLFSR